MISIYSLSALVAAYLFGSIHTAVWIGQDFYGIDVREYGSGNAGATNTFRVLGKKAGIAVMILDILKGWTATNLAYLIGISVTGPQHSVQFVNYQLALGIIAVMGHLFPVFAGPCGGSLGPLQIHRCRQTAHPSSARLFPMLRRLLRR